MFDILAVFSYAVKCILLLSANLFLFYGRTERLLLSQREGLAITFMVCGVWCVVRVELVKYVMLLL